MGASVAGWPPQSRAASRLPTSGFTPRTARWAPPCGVWGSDFQRRAVNGSVESWWYRTHQTQAGLDCFAIFQYWDAMPSMMALRPGGRG